MFEVACTLRDFGSPGENGSFLSTECQEGKTHSRRAKEGPRESLQGLHSSEGFGVNPSSPRGMQTSRQL